MADKKTTKTSFYHNIKDLKFDSLVYPNDLNPGNFYPDCICFSIKKRIGVSVDDVSKALSAGTQATKNAWNSVDTEGNFVGKYPEELQPLINTAVKNADKQAAPKVQQEAVHKVINAWYAEDPKRGKPPSHMFDVITAGIKKFASEMQTKQKELKLQKSSEARLGQIYLNMPNGIQFAEAANWAGTELGFMGKMTQDLVSGSGASGDALKTLTGAAAGSAGNIVGAAVGAIPSLVSKLGIQGGMFGAAIGAMAAGGPMQKGLESALGVASNPYLEMMFSGIGFRKFSFEFILRPKSTDEVKTVAQILRMFRTFTKPTYTEGDLGKAFMDYPMEFGIEFLTSSTEASFKSDEGDSRSGKSGGQIRSSYIRNTHVPKIKTCVCDNVSSNFTPQSVWAAHKLGSPVAVTLSLSFQETELVMAEDVHKDETEGGGY